MGLEFRASLSRVGHMFGVPVGVSGYLIRASV